MRLCHLGFIRLGRETKFEVLVTRFEYLSRAASPPWIIFYARLSLSPDSRSHPRSLGPVLNASPGPQALPGLSANVGTNAFLGSPLATIL